MSDMEILALLWIVWVAAVAASYSVIVHGKGGNKDDSK